MVGLPARGKTYIAYKGNGIKYISNLSFVKKLTRKKYKQ